MALYDKLTMVLLSIPAKDHQDNDYALALELLDVIQPKVLVTDAFLPWSKSLALAALAFDIRIVGAQPWKSDVDTKLRKKFVTFNVFNESPSQFLENNSIYFDWLNSYITKGIMIKDANSSLTHSYLVNLQDKQIYEQER